MDLVGPAVQLSDELVLALTTRAQGRVELAARLELVLADASEETDDAGLASAFLEMVEDLAFYSPKPDREPGLIDDEELARRLRAVVRTLRRDD